MRPRIRYRLPPAFNPGSPREISTRSPPPSASRGAITARVTSGRPITAPLTALSPPPPGLYLAHYLG